MEAAGVEARLYSIICYRMVVVRVRVVYVCVCVYVCGWGMGVAMV